MVQLREPSSYVPDDDVITQPVNNELSFYERYVSSDKSAEVLNSRNQIKVWNENQTFADQYGLSTTLRGSAFFVPTPEEKFAYFKEKYMRYLKRKGEQPFKDLPKNWYQDYRASNEIDTIDEMELRFKNSNKTAGDETVLPESLRTKEISLWKGTQFIFQPRLDQGVLVVGLRGPLLTAKAWVGVNGQTEINFQKSVESIGFRVMFNYYAHSGKYFSSVDQRLAQNVYARVTSNKDPTTKLLDNTLMMLYAKQF
ncbi:MAG TPA: hypothetical protein VNJ01_09975 [Bacteriovoracaceae bacterium]|nr:hypothetical protein [Bacteriovoracaceae bacterium]